MKIVNDTFERDRCDHHAPDLGGGAVRALSHYTACSNGAGLSGIGVSWTVLNSRFMGNRAIGSGANPASGAPREAVAAARSATTATG